ncbi:MAG: hypothetical protein HFH67_07950 [Lachnospiraceae bacterium]|nr:hypothetical protein [Lachnospiraceae bacterium]
MEYIEALQVQGFSEACSQGYSSSEQPTGILLYPSERILLYSLVIHAPLLVYG